MKIEIKVIPGAKRNLIKNEGVGLKIYLTAPPVDGQANLALIKILAEHFAVKKAHIHILKGLHSPRKTVSIVMN